MCVCVCVVLVECTLLYLSPCVPQLGVGTVVGGGESSFSSERDVLHVWPEGIFPIETESKRYPSLSLCGLSPSARKGRSWVVELE